MIRLEPGVYHGDERAFALIALPARGSDVYHLFGEDVVFLQRLVVDIVRAEKMTVVLSDSFYAGDVLESLDFALSDRHRSAVEYIRIGVDHLEAARRLRRLLQRGVALRGGLFRVSPALGRSRLRGRGR